MGCGVSQGSVLGVFLLIALYHLVKYLCEAMFYGEVYTMLRYAIVVYITTCY